MPTYTPYYNLALYNGTTDTGELFSDYRAAVNGVSNSNMTKLDSGLFDLQIQLNKRASGVYLVPSTEVAANTYSYTGVYGIEAYSTGLTIMLTVDVDNTGASTVNINGLGARDLKKNQADGTVIDVASGDLVAGKAYYFVYTSSNKWLWTTSNTSVASASTTAEGIVELATSAETTTGTDATRAVTPDGLAGSDYGKRVVEIQVTDPNGSTLSVADGLAYFRVPSVMNGWNLVSVAAHVTTVSSSGTPTVQIHNLTDAQDMLSTAITIDVNETDSSTAATPAVINTTYDDVATADIIRIDLDVAGTGTKGLIVEMIFQLP